MKMQSIGYSYSRIETFLLYGFIFCFKCRYTPETLIFGISMSDFSKLLNLYWFVRYHRKKNIKRRYYRYIADEKKRLIASGVDSEELRLLCRTLARRLNLHAEKRLKTYRESMLKDRISSGT